MDHSRFYFKKIKVKKEHIDENHHVNNIVYLQWVHQISEEHWRTMTRHMDVTHHAWIVSYQQIRYLHELREDEEIELKTWVQKTEKHRSARMVEFYRNEQLCATALIEWTLLNKESGRPMRIPEAIKDLFDQRFS